MSTPMHFQPGDRAISNHTVRGALGTPGISYGILYYVHSVTTTDPQYLFLSADDKARGNGWEASRFDRVRPKLIPARKNNL